MQLANLARTEIKQHIVAIVITLIITIGYWGAGFWALDQPDWGGGVDRPIYINAARNFFAQENLYVDINRVLPDDLIFYNYSPLSILWVGLVSLLPPAVLYILHLAAVVALFFLWKAIFQKIQLEIPAWIIPIWGVYSAFLYDAITLNINVFLALLATLYLWFNLQDDRFARLGAILMLFLIITTKPQWGFLALLPLVQKQWRKFLQISAGVAVLYIFLWGLASIFTSPGYVLEQHILFAKHLGTFTQRFSYWNLPPGSYEYNNSMHQVTIYLTGNVKAGLVTTGYIQLGLFAILAIMFLRVILKVRQKDLGAASVTSLQWFFILYCATLLLPPLNFDFSLGIPMFLFLAVQGKVQKITLAMLFPFIAFQDTISMLIRSFGISGWFPFIFTATVISLVFLLMMNLYSVSVKRRIV
jgi:hypothetical protein